MLAMTLAASVTTAWAGLPSSSTNRGVSRTMSSTQEVFTSSGSRSTPRNHAAAACCSSGSDPRSCSALRVMAARVGRTGASAAGLRAAAFTIGAPPEPALGEE